MTLSESIEVVGQMLKGYPNGQNVPNSYIGALASVIAQYPRCVTHKAGDAIAGVPRETRFLPTPADVVAWCERETEELRGIVAREDHEKRLAAESKARAAAAVALEQSRAIRPTLQQMQERYGERWGMGELVKEDLRIKDAAMEGLARANRLVFERECTAAGVDPNSNVSPELMRLIREKQQALAARAGEYRDAAE